jgi:SAM-dependent methyltransferase
MTVQYDPVAAQYARLIAPRYAPIAALVADVADPAPDADVVELAAGTGALTRLLAPLVVDRGSYVALDVSPAMLAEACVDRRVRRVVADLARTPLPDRCADLVASSLGPAQSREAVDEAARLLRPGGRFAVVTWGDDYAELRLLNAARQRVGLAPYPVAVADGACRHLTDVGFVDVRATTVRLPVVHPSVADYLAYRAAFGCPPGLAPERLPELLSATAVEAQACLDDAGRVHLDWQLVLVEGTTRE